MTNKEKYLNYQRERESLRARLTSLPADIARLKGETDPLEDEIVRLEIIGSTGVEDRREMQSRNLGMLQDLEHERERMKRRLHVLEQVMTEARGHAEIELRPIFTRKFAQSLKQLVQALRAAHRAEIELRDIREEAIRAFQGIDSPAHPIPDWSPVLMLSYFSSEMKPELTAFILKMKDLGFDVS